MPDSASQIQWLEGKGLFLYAQLLHGTAAFRVNGQEFLEEGLRGNSPVVLAAWHGQTHQLLAFLHGRIDLSRFVIIITDDHRTGVLASFASAIGADSFAIATQDNSMGGARRMLELIRGLRAKGFCYVNPDGPDGPPRIAKPGVAFIATRAEASILPVGSFSWPRYEQRRWDRYALPLPFARISVAFRPPIVVERHSDRADLLAHLSSEMTAAIEEARELHRAG